MPRDEPPTASGVRLAVKQRRRVRNQSVGETKRPTNDDPPKWSVAGVVDAPVCCSFLMYDKGPAAPPSSRRGPNAVGFGFDPLPSAFRLSLDVRRRRVVLYELAVLALLLTYPALQKGGA